ncbi:glycosyltransferase family 4 protein [Edwardsiella tarda]
MKICMLVPSLEKKGPVIVAVNLAKELLGKGFSVDLMPLKMTVLDPIFLSDVHVECFNFLKLKKYDIVHSHCLVPDSINVLQRMFFKKKSITTIHNNIFSDFQFEYPFIKAFIIKNIWRFIFHMIEKRVCLTRTMRNIYIEKYGCGDFFYVYNGVPRFEKETLSDADVNNLKLLKKIKSTNVKIVGTCGVLTQRKGISSILSMIDKVKGDYFFVVVGDGNQKKELLEIAKKNNILNVCFFDKTLAPRAYMRLFDIYIMPSISEGFGLAAVEGRLAGCQLVCSDIPTFNEMFEDKDGVSFFKLNDVSSLESALNFECGRLNMNKHSEFLKFTVMNMAEGYEKIYEN